MEDEEDEPDASLQSQLLAVKHCLEVAKRKEHRHEASELDSPCPRKKRNCIKYHRHNAWQSVFSMNVLNNPNIQSPSHPDAIKFRRQFRVPYSLFVTIVEMFRTRDGWNPSNSDDPQSRAPHPLEIKILCSLFVLGRGTDLDTVSMLSHISIGSLTSFHHHFCAKMSTLYDEHIFMPNGEDKL